MELRCLGDGFVLKDKEGNRLFRRVDITVIFAPDSIPTRKLTQHAKPHQGFGPSNIDDILDSLTDQLDTLYPFWQFRLVELAPIGRTAKFVFEFCGYRAPTKTSEQITKEAEASGAPTV